MTQTAMQARQNWESKRSPEGCPFCLPRVGIDELFVEIARLSIATLYLERIQTYRGHCVLVFDAHHATRIDELTEIEWAALSQDLRAAEGAVMQAFAPDHINVASIGQVVPHLHWHIVPRYVDDPRWGGPIWTTTAEEMPKVYLDADAYAERVGVVRAALTDGGV